MAPQVAALLYFGRTVSTGLAGSTDDESNQLPGCPVLFRETVPRFPHKLTHHQLTEVNPLFALFCHKKARVIASGHLDKHLTISTLMLRNSGTEFGEQPGQSLKMEKDCRGGGEEGKLEKDGEKSETGDKPFHHFRRFFRKRDRGDDGGRETTELEELGRRWRGAGGEEIKRLSHTHLSSRGLSITVGPLSAPRNFEGRHIAN